MLGTASSDGGRPGPVVVPLQAIRPYLSVIVLECADPDPVAAFHRLRTELRRLRMRRKGRQEVLVVAEGADQQQLPSDDEVPLLVDALVVEVSAPPGWATEDAGFTETWHELAVWLGRSGLVASIDGILTADGFVATELNPRQSSGLGVRRRWPGFPINLVQRALQAHDRGMRDAPSAELEVILRDAIAQHPVVDVRVPRGERTDPAVLHVELDDAGRRVPVRITRTTAEIAAHASWLERGELAAPVAEQLAEIASDLPLVGAYRFLGLRRT